VCCSVLQCVAVCCSVLQCKSSKRSVCNEGPYECALLSQSGCVAVCCSVLQCVAVYMLKRSVCHNGQLGLPYNGKSAVCMYIYI